MTERSTTLRRRLHGLMFRLPGMMTCREFEGFVLTYLDGDLPHRQKRLFELHLSLCRECRAYLQAYERAIQLTGRLSKDSAKELADVPADLVAAIIAARE